MWSSIAADTRSMSETSHTVREAIAHVADLEIDQLTPADMDALRAMADGLTESVEEELFRRRDAPSD